MFRLQLPLFAALVVASGGYPAAAQRSDGAGPRAMLALSAETRPPAASLIGTQLEDYFSFTVTTDGRYALTWRLKGNFDEAPSWFVAPSELALTYRRTDTAGGAHRLAAATSRPIKGDWMEFTGHDASGGESKVSVGFVPVALSPGPYRFDVGPSNGIHLSGQQPFKVLPASIFLSVPANPGAQHAEIEKLAAEFRGRSVVIKKAINLLADSSFPAGTTATITEMGDDQGWFEGSPGALADVGDVSPIGGYDNLPFVTVANCVSVTLGSPEGGYSMFRFRSIGLVKKYFTLTAAVK